MTETSTGSTNNSLFQLAEAAEFIALTEEMLETLSYAEFINATGIETPPTNIQRQIRRHYAPKPSSNMFDTDSDENDFPTGEPIPQFTFEDNRSGAPSPSSGASNTPDIPHDLEAFYSYADFEYIEPSNVTRRIDFD